jgi:prophage regulatory protein
MSITENSTSQIRFIRKREVMHLTGLSATGIYDLMARNLFPKSIKLAGGKAVAWLESDVNEWLKQCVDKAKNQN